MTTAAMEKEIFYQALTRRIRILILIISFIPMLLTTSVLFYRFNRTYTEKIHAHLSELVQKHSHNIDAFLLEKIGNIKYLARQYDSRENPQLFLKKHLAGLKAEYGDVFTDLGIVDENGIQMAYEGPFRLENANYANAAWFIQALEKPYFVSDVFVGLRGHPHFIIAVRLNSGKQKFILRATINFGAFNSLVENIHIGRTGIAFVINDRARLQTKGQVKICSDILSLIPEPGNADRHETIVSRQKDASGKKYLYVASMLKNIDWMMVFRQDIDDAFQELRRAQMLALVIFLAGCVAIIWVALILPRDIISRLAMAEEKSEAMNQQIVESGKLATIGELAAGIAHEINNPVAIMMEEAGWIGDLLDEEEFKQTRNMEEFMRALHQIHTQGLRCKEITHKLLSFARKTDSTQNDVQINDAITEIVSLTAQMARYNNVSIKTHFQKDLPLIRISPSELQQVILNLINNAIDAMEKNGGTIMIETKISQIEKSHLVIVIEDNGPGIPKDNLDRIFDPFFTTKPVGKGTGLGLSICFGIIQKIGGKIDVRSQVGKGTRFRIWLPFENTETAAAEKTDAELY